MKTSENYFNDDELVLTLHIKKTRFPNICKAASVPGSSTEVDIRIIPFLILLAEKELVDVYGREVIIDR